MNPKTLTAVFAAALTTAVAAASITALALTAGAASAANTPTAGLVTTAVDSAAAVDPADPAAKKARHKAGKGGLAGRALHGEFVVPAAGGKTTDIAVQRGEVTAVSPTSITLRSTDGFSRTYVLTPTSKVHIGKAAAKITDVKTGAKGAVVAVKNGAGYDVRRLTLRAA